MAVRYSEDAPRAEGAPHGGMPTNLPGQMRQWWRLKQAREGRSKVLRGFSEVRMRGPPIY